MSSVLSHPWLLFFVILIGLMLVVEIGVRLRLLSTGIDEQRQSLVESARDGLTLLLSFLLGFALPMTLPYYEARRDLVIKEADAISTVDERAQLLPHPYDERIRQLLPEYVDARLDFAREAEDGAVRAATVTAARLQHAMWNETVALVHERPDLVNGPLVAQVGAALGDLSDLSKERLAAYERRIPGTIWFVLVSVAVAACFVVGYSMRRRLILATLVLPLTVATVLSLVCELENPSTGFIQIGQESMQRLQVELRAEFGR